ncbi:MAG: 2-succinyl-5-enolpyruvyl-6-hydroxy-3-cyclohexene-1-carboxylic-acid synthase [Actinomycetales bacterium]
MLTSCEAAARIVAGLLAQGVRDVCLSPGSRSAPLAYALASAEREGRVRLHVRHDERTAGFLALGAGKANPRHPAAVVTTSGTAVANLLPAALEAHHAGVGVLLVTADRPARLRGTWANQTSDLQSGLFTEVAHWARDVEPAALAEPEIDLLVAEAVSAARRGAVVHLNACFDDPLQPPAGESVSLPEVLARPAPEQDPPALSHRVLDRASGTVVVAGDGAGPGARLLAQQHRLPLLAEPSSGARGGPCLVPCYREVLADAGDRVQRAVVFGRPTLSRPVTRLLEDPAVEVVLVGVGPGPGRTVLRAGSVDFDRGGDPQWLGWWLQAGRQRAARLGEQLAGWGRATGLHAAAHVLAATEADEALVLGASNPIRDADLAAGAVRDGALVLANRGLAGIDGTVSTAIGVALATGRRTRALVGDLTFLHDLAGLALPALERQRPQVQVVVANDDGGGIFQTLEHSQHPREFERIFGTPLGADLASACAAFGVTHQRVESIEALRSACAAMPEGVSVVEVPTHRQDRAALAGRNLR